MDSLTTSDNWYKVDSDNAIIIIILGIIAYFLAKFFDNIWTKYSKKRRNKKILKKKHELIIISALKNYATWKSYVRNANHYMLKAIFFLVITIYFNPSVDIERLNAIIPFLGNFLSILYASIHFIIYMFAVFNTVNSFSLLNTLRKARKREEIPDDELDEYDKKKFGLTLKELNRRKDDPKEE